MTQFPENQPVNWIRSVYRDDQEVRDIVSEFVKEMPSRIERANNAFMRGDTLRLHFWAHQLKGGASGYGFPEISKRAAELEQAIINKQTTDEIYQAMLRVIDLCERVSDS